MTSTHEFTNEENLETKILDKNVPDKFLRWNDDRPLTSCYFDINFLLRSIEFKEYRKDLII